MAAARSRSGALSVVILAACLLLSVHIAPVFLPAPGAHQASDVQLRGAPAVAAMAAAAVPFVAVAEPDEYIEYNMAGEWTSYMVGMYFVITTAGTLFAFAAYFILTKLKII